jgi:glycosyltransferase 2 family protein
VGSQHGEIVPTGAGQKPAWRPRTLLKFGVTVVLCTLILWQADWSVLGSTMKDASVAGFLAVVVLMFLSVPLSAYKWRLLLAVHDINYPFQDLHRWYYTAVFFNNFFPSTIGGDGYRLLRTLNNPRSRACAVIAILVERLSGFAVLLVMGYLAAAVLYIGDSRADADGLVRLILVAGGAGMAAVIIGAIMLGLSGMWSRFLSAAFWPERARLLFGYAGEYGSRPGHALWALGGVSVGFHLHTIAFYWILMWSLGDPPSFLVLTVMLAVTTTAGLLPVTINGIGLVDATFVYLASWYGLNFEVALATMLAVRFINILISLVGGYLYAAGGGRVARLQDELAGTAQGRSSDAAR